MRTPTRAGKTSSALPQSATTRSRRGSDNEDRRPVLVVGVGNPHRGDDGAGVAVVRRLRRRGRRALGLVEVRSDVTRLLDCWRPSDTVVLIDAMSSGAPPGTVRRFDATTKPLPARAFRGTSTHGLDVVAAIELARTLRRLPRRLLLYGIEGACFDGSSLSAPVEAAVRDVASSLQRLRARRSPRAAWNPPTPPSNRDG